MDQAADYVVVGAGLSGLYAACRLLGQRKNVVVLESRDRVGGRIWTLHLTYQSHELPIDLGAQWIGEDHHRLRALAGALGLATVRTPQPRDVAFDLFGCKGLVRPPLFSTILSIPPEAWPLRGPFALNEAWKVSVAIDELGARIKRWDAAQQPWTLPDAVELDGSFVKWVGGITGYGKVPEYTQFLATAGYCHDANDLSALGIATHVLKCGKTAALDRAERYIFRHGSSDLPLVLQKILEGRVHLKTNVKAIEQDGSVVSVHAGDNVWKAKRVIVAVPPVLASRIKMEIDGDDRARMQLHGKRELLSDIPQGKVTKYVLAYRSAFWREGSRRARYIGDISAVDMVFDATPKDQKEDAPGKLACFVRGPKAESWRADSPAARKAVLDTLVSYLGKEAGEPIEFKCHDWTKDLLSLGGFGAVYRPGVLTTHRSSLSAATGRIHWAGTETAREWPNYMEGALEAAERAADEVLSSP